MTNLPNLCGLNNQWICEILLSAESSCILRRLNGSGVLQNTYCPWIIEEEIKELFPDIPTYVTYNAPFWKLRVGDFRSHEEAYQLMRQLMEAFPDYAKEMYIVKEEVKIPLN